VFTDLKKKPSSIFMPNKLHIT